MTLVPSRILAGLACLALCAMSAADVWYVDKDNAPGVEDGLSWGTAYTTIQPAVDADSDGDGIPDSVEGTGDLNDDTSCDASNPDSSFH